MASIGARSRSFSSRIVWRMAALHVAIVSGAFLAIESARSRTADSRSSTGTTRLTSPMRWAVSAPNRSRGEEDLCRPRGANHAGQRLNPVVAVAEPEAGRGHTELAVRAADAQVSLQCDDEPSTDAVATDHGDERFGDLVPGAPGLCGCSAVVGAGFGGCSLLAELRDVRSGDERPRPGARHDDDPNARIRVERGECPRHSLVASPPTRRCDGWGC